MTISFNTFIGCEKYGIEVKSKNLIIFSSSIVTEHPTSVWKAYVHFWAGAQKKFLLSSSLHKYLFIYHLINLVALIMQVLDAMRDKNDIHMEIRSTILEMEELCRDAPLKDLWTNNSWRQDYFNLENQFKFFKWNSWEGRAVVM